MIDELILYGKNTFYVPVLSIYKMAIGTEAFSENDFINAINQIIKISGEYKFSENCYRSYIAWLIINDENPYSLDCEMRINGNPSLRSFASLDMELLMKMFFLDISEISFVSHNAKMLFSLANSSEIKNYSVKTNLTDIGDHACMLGKMLSETKSCEEFLNVVDEFYRKNGVGMFGINKAFRLKEHTDGNFSLVPVSSFDSVSFDDLWGYQYQKEMLMENTECFLNGDPSNNILLYGDSGTGKSTCIKALLNKYHTNGLRIIEIYKHEFKFLSPLLNILKKRNYFFILYMDDLSFEDFEIEYKYLKAIIEGGMETRPHNVLIYATSNRRHLIRETWKDREDYDKDLHHSDTMQEKLSLSERFGISINFEKPVQKDYFEIVYHLAKKYDLKADKKELTDKARAWGVQHGGYSGRVAKQLIDYLISKK